jgi:hypothetical protein
VDELARKYAAALGPDADSTTAEPLLRECQEVAKASLWKGDWLPAELASRQGDCLRRQGRYAEAEPILVDAAQTMGRAIGAPPHAVTTARERAFRLYEAWGKPEEAVKWR